MIFTPNWVRMGFKDQAEAWKYVIDKLVENRNAICGRSLDGTSVFTLGNRLITITGKKKK